MLRQRLALGGSVGLLVLGAALMAPHGNVFHLATVYKFWAAAAVMGVGFMLSWGVRSIPGGWFWGAAIAPRLLLLPMEPGDDVWRYLWEGYIQTLGVSPYHLPPNAAELLPYRTDWWSQINHPDVSAIYPPITQLGFRGLATLAVSVLLFKVAFVVADLLVCWLLSRRHGHRQASLYAWNPMVIYAFAGGAHYDSWFILPLVAAWFLMAAPTPASADSPNLPRSAPILWGAALLIGLSAAVKWISLPLLGWPIWALVQRRKLWVAIATGLVGVLPLLLAAIPFCQIDTCPLIPTDSTFVSHGRSAEFIPHWLAQIWPASAQVNWIYGIPLVLLVLWLLRQHTPWRQFATGYWFGVFLLSPIIHFWYFTWIVPFAVPNQNWGVRWLSLSSFIYFVLPPRLPDWRLTTVERLLLWLPFILGWLWTWKSSSQQILRQPSSTP